MTHTTQTPSDWVVRWAPLVRPGGTVLDLACGYGRHARLFAACGHPVVAADRDAAALATLAGEANIETRVVDLEAQGAPWPFGAARFAGIVVTNYLHRPLFPPLLDALEEGGVLIYETFMAGNERYGKPSNPAFLLRPHELLEQVHGRLAVVAFEQGEVASPRPAVVQRICAVRGGGPRALLPG
ncbi:MAG: methyltransferase domain-containing protein [Pseudomonadota bacterium]